MVHGSIRVMPGCFITGQAAGVAAAMSAESNTAPRQIDVAKLQQRLKALGGYSAELLKATTSPDLAPCLALANRTKVGRSLGLHGPSDRATPTSQTFESLPTVDPMHLLEAARLVGCRAIIPIAEG